MGTGLLVLILAGIVIVVGLAVLVLRSNHDTPTTREMGMAEFEAVEGHESEIDIEKHEH